VAEDDRIGAEPAAGRAVGDGEAGTDRVGHAPATGPEGQVVGPDRVADAPGAGGPGPEDRGIEPAPMAGSQVTGGAPVGTQGPTVAAEGPTVAVDPPGVGDAGGESPDVPPDPVLTPDPAAAEGRTIGGTPDLGNQDGGGATAGVALDPEAVTTPVAPDGGAATTPVGATPVGADAGAGGIPTGPAGARGADRERDRDQVDFSAVTSFLRRRGIIGPARVAAAAPVLLRPPPPVDERPPGAGRAPERDPAPLLLPGIALPDRAVLRRYLPPVVMVLLIGWIAMIHHLPGVDWGDDFALYMRQAKGLAMGNIGEVVGANRFAVENSGWSTFSPYSYPWGWPILVAPVYAVFGLNYEPVKLLEVAAFCVFLLCFYDIVRRRAGALGATVLTLLIGLSPSFVGATDTVLSDIPFLCFVGLTLWWLDRCRERGILEESRRRLVILGLLLAYTFNIRREGIGLLVALLAVHISVIGARSLRDRTSGALWTVDWKAVALPYLTFAGAAAAFHLLLPTVLRPASTGTGLSNIPHRFKWQQDILAEHVGLKDFGFPTQLLGSERLGKNALTLLMVLAVVGLVARLLARHREDVALAAYLCAATFVVLVSPYQEGRYLFTITPLLVYFAYQAFPAVAELVSPANRRMVRLAVIPPALAIAGLALVNANDLRHAIDYRRLYKPVVNGPEAPDAKQMFAAVKTLTRGDDVILFFRARAMTLYTDRLAVQGSDLDLMLPRSDWYVMAKGSTYSQTPLTDDEGSARGLTKAWENELWVIWRIPPPTA